MQGISREEDLGKKNREAKNPRNAGCSASMGCNSDLFFGIIGS